jgi:UDP-N-acetyl-D-mannosaminuronate dehydrogenase
MDVPAELPSPEGLDAVVVAVPHDSYRQLDFERWLGEARPVVLDAFDVLAPSQRDDLVRIGCRVASIGRGERQ